MVYSYYGGAYNIVVTQDADGRVAGSWYLEGYPSYEENKVEGQFTDADKNSYFLRVTINQGSSYDDLNVVLRGGEFEGKVIADVGGMAYDTYCSGERI